MDRPVGNPTEYQTPLHAPVGNGLVSLRVQLPLATFEKALSQPQSLPPFSHCLYLIGTRLNHDLVPQNGIVLQLRGTTASQNCHFCMFADKCAERGYCNESDAVLCMK